MKAIVLTLTTLLLFTANPLLAQSKSSSSRPWLLSPSAAARESKRFTLQEWLENKDRRALMDMWLSINTPSPYEMVIGTSLQNYDVSTKAGNANEVLQSHSTQFTEISAYALFVGVTLEHTNNRSENFSDLTGMFNLRIFGETVQGSHITLHYGLRTRTGDNNLYRLNQSFPAATMQIYLMNYFGIQGNYRAFAPVTEAYYGDTTAKEVNYGIFIEYGLLRLFGDVYQETQTSLLDGVQTDILRKGGRVGLKFYF